MVQRSYFGNQKAVGDRSVTMNTGSTVIVHKKIKYSKTRMDCLRSVLDGVKHCMNASIDEEEVAALKAELDSALRQLEEERLFVEDLLEEKKSDESRHFKEIGKLVDEKMRAVFFVVIVRTFTHQENTILKEHIDSSREYCKEGAKELNSVIDKLHRTHNDLIGDHRLLQRKYAAAASERRSWQAQVEQSFIALQNASTANKAAEDELALQQAQTEQYRLHATILAQEAEDQKRGAEEFSIALEEAVAAKKVAEEELALQSDQYRSNAHILVREVEVREKVAEKLRSKIQEMTLEIIRIKSHLAESERSKQRLVDDETAQGFFLDSLWERVYDPTRRSLPIEEIEALRDERESLTAAVEAKDSIIDDLTFRLAVTTPLPADGCSPTELLIVELYNRVEKLTDQLSTSEETVSKLNLEVHSLMEEEEVLVEELSFKREKVHQLQVVEEMMKSKVEELSA
ncbi:hypothetical protein FRC03_002544 [Tulasnella sp. 419]|nr:hypothetical protein FRC03_002544 [Tulasnella sp. 419]